MIFMTKHLKAELSGLRILILVVYSSLVWFGVSQYIRYGGPAGDFAGKKAITTYIATFLVTIPLNRFSRKLVGLPAEKMVSVSAVCLMTTTTLEGIAMNWFPKIYGGDPAVIGAGAVWLLWAVGVALGLAVLTSLRAGKHLEAGERAPAIITQTIEGKTVEVPDPQGRLTHVQFLRFAGCPVCNLLLQSYIKRSAELQAAGVREVIFFHSESRYIQDYHAQLPFEVTADPRRTFYKQYKVERSPRAILSPQALPNLIRGYRLRTAGKQDSTPFGLPAEFLIAADGTIVASHYGIHSSDQWTVDDVLAIAHGRHTVLPATSFPMEGLRA